MSTKVAVVIPTYKEELSPLEQIALVQCRKILGRYPLIFFTPAGKIFSYFKPDDGVAHFPSQYFQNVDTYNTLMLSPNFYETFKDFEYILIYQLDAFVFYDALEDFCSLGYDYIGAPWPIYSWSGARNPTPTVGNGGFSLRKVKSCLDLLKICVTLPNWYTFLKYNEDAFFASCGVKKNIDFNTAPFKIADTFSMEWTPARAVRRLGNALPFGCHNWSKFSADFYVELFAQLGYDLRPLRAQMGNRDYEYYVPHTLMNLAMERIVRRVERGQSISRYLPTKSFASVRVLRDSRAMKVLSRLVWEENSLTDKIFIYAEKDWRDLIRDVERENLPHLVITLDDDKSLIAAIERKGLSYGKHVVSFQREYLIRCEELFHKLGK